ncbi:class I SAM-dependent methyltransferase [Roseospira navarrensis]|nr:class I SAM-dependent methyltransferase [Roseospira navarrensis]
MINRIARKLGNLTYGTVESIFRIYEHSNLSRAPGLADIPKYKKRQGGLGTTTYGEWCYTVGLFQGILKLALPAERPLKILDVGCGVGRLYLAARPSMNEEDHYTGLDLSKRCIDICKSTYKEDNATFVYYSTNNSYYKSKEANNLQPWPLEDNSFNMVTALSVWTHLREEDWVFYLSEVKRVLSPGGKAVISFFVLDKDYDAALPRKTDEISPYYPQQKNKWIFDKGAYGSKNWLCPAWVSVPEVAIGVREHAFLDAIEKAGLRISRFHSGSWKDQPALFFQDIVELEHKLD